jgi:hypothetical protein
MILREFNLAKECGFINVEIFALLTKWGEALA